MKQSGALHQVFWQNPYVDILKNWPISEKSNADKQGDISEYHDKQLGKKVLKISGAVSGANYITIPSKRNGKKTLGLVGRYVYVQLQAPPAALYSFHFEYTAMGKQIKLSFSNLFKTIKVISDTNLQIPLREQLNKWTILFIDVKALIRELFVLNQKCKGKKNAQPIPEEKDIEIEMTHCQVCAKLLLRSIYTSDTIYSSKNMPKEIGFRLSKNEKFEKVYQWFTLDSAINPDLLKENKENDGSEADIAINSSEVKPEPPVSKTLEAKSPVKVTPKLTNKTQNEVSIKASRKAKPFGDSKITPDEQEESPLESTIQPQPQPDRSTVQSAFIGNSQFQSTKNVAPTTVKFKSEHFTLEPNPIMSLCHFQGFQSKSRNMQFLDEQKIVYSCGNTISLLDTKTKFQTFFIGQLGGVSCLAVNKNQNLILSCDDSDENGKIYLWSIFPQRLETSFYSGLKNIQCCDVAYRKENQRKTVFGIISGKDKLNRSVIAIFDISDFQYKEPYLFCKQISDFDIKALKFLDSRDATRFISCGKENVRFWKLKHKVITGQSLMLGEHARGTIFRDFAMFNYQTFGATEEANYKIIFCSDQGNVHLVDYNDQEMFAIFKLHDGAIQTVGVNPANHYFITAGEDKYVRLWNMDLSQMLQEVKIDSQVHHFLINQNDQIFCGTQNGTIGELKLEDKNMDYIIRSHNDSILMVDYHPLTKNLVSISNDLTIKIWTVRNGYLVQTYEYKCIDEPVTFVRCLSQREYFVAGFESGSLRVFDILRNTLVGELERHESEVIDIQVSPDDKFLVTVEKVGKVQVFDQNLDFIKGFTNDLKYQKQFAVFDCYSKFLAIKHNPNTLRIYETDRWTLKFSINIEEEIIKISFSPTKGDLFILTSRARLKKCKLDYKDIKVEREYWSLHNGLISDFQISKNGRYIFTIGEDNLLKVWDYFMRGKLTPAFQSYTIGTRFNQVVLSNDDNNLVFTYGLENNAIFCFDFKSDLVQMIQEEEVPELPQQPHQMTAQIDKFGDDIEDDNRQINSRTDLTRMRMAAKANQQIAAAEALQQEELKQAEMGEVKSIYHKAEDRLGVTSSTIKMKEDQLQYEQQEQQNVSPTKKEVRFDETAGGGGTQQDLQATRKVLFQQSNNNTQSQQMNSSHSPNPKKQQQPGSDRKISARTQKMIDECIEEATKPKFKDVAKDIADLTYGDHKKIAFKDAEQYYFTAENQAKESLEEQYKEAPYEPTYKMPGQFMQLKSIIGSSFDDFCHNLVWNSEENYIAYSLQSAVVVMYLEEPKTQRYLNDLHTDEISHIKLSNQNRYLISASKEAKNEASCIINAWDATKLVHLRSITHSSLSKIHSVDISPCENYILVLGQSAYDDYAMLFLWEIQSGLLVTNTIYRAKNCKQVKWNKIIRGALEFILITEDNIVLWRLGIKRNLEYQEANYDRLIMKGHKMTCVDFLESKLFKDTAFMFVGTNQGSLMVFDTRSNTLLFTCNNFIKSPILNIFTQGMRVTLTGFDANLYSWQLPEKTSDPSDLAKFLQETPEIMLVDSRPTTGFLLPESYGDEGILATKSGILWYIDWNERVTLRMSTSHTQNSAITSVKAHYQPGENTILVTAGTDGAVRIWNAHTLEQKIEFYVPRKEAICLDIHEESNKCVCGFSDGHVRFFDYQKNINYGGALLQNQPKEENVQKKDDDLFNKNKHHPITAVKFLNHQNNILAGNMNGEIFMIYVKSWENMRIEINCIIEHGGFAINHFAISDLEPWDTFLMCTKNRKMMVWNRKDLSFNQRKDLDYYKKSFSNVYDITYYQVDNYKVTQKTDQEKNFDDFNQEIHPINKYEYQGDTIAYFAPKKPDLAIVITNQISEIFFRDYKAHMVFKTLKVDGLPRSLFIRDRQSEIVVGTKEGFIKFIEYETGIERDKISLSNDGIKNIELCLPKQQFSLDTLAMEPVGEDFRMVICSSRNGVFISQLDV